MITRVRDLGGVRPKKDEQGPMERRHEIEGPLIRNSLKLGEAQGWGQGWIKMSLRYLEP